MNWLSFFILLVLCIPLGYLYLLALASIRVRALSPSRRPSHRFAIAIPAHNEAGVIGRTIDTLRQMDYPAHLFDIHVVADHCSDNTAEAARRAGATAHERSDGPRGGKGAALSWLFGRILLHSRDSSQKADYDAVVVFDADTQVDPNFLRVMDARLTEGEQVIQGQHRISNPNDGWFPALTAAMFIIDNRFQNMGRANLGWSAKNMGDSICFRADVLRRLGWGEGLTEDYAFRQQLLLHGIKIAYEPTAIGYGEAAQTWRIARAQRARWLRGTHDASRRYTRALLTEGLRRHDLALLDGVVQSRLPSYSTLTLITSMMWLASFIMTRLNGRIWTGASAELLPATTIILALLFAYPLIGLAIERAPAKAYAAILSGPLFIIWRSWLALSSRFGQRQVQWVRTPRKGQHEV